MYYKTVHFRGAANTYWIFKGDHSSTHYSPTYYQKARYSQSRRGAFHYPPKAYSLLPLPSPRPPPVFHPKKLILKEMEADSGKYIGIRTLMPTADMGKREKKKVQAEAVCIRTSGRKARKKERNREEKVNFGPRGENGLRSRKGRG